MPPLNGLEADFLFVNTAERIRRIGVGLPSTETSEGGAARDAVSDGVAEGEKSRETRADSLSVADATLRRSPVDQYVASECGLDHAPWDFGPNDSAKTSTEWSAAADSSSLPTISAASPSSLRDCKVSPFESVGGSRVDPSSDLSGAFDDDGRSLSMLRLIDRPNKPVKLLRFGMTFGATLAVLNVLLLLQRGSCERRPTGSIVCSCSPLGKAWAEEEVRGEWSSGKTGENVCGSALRKAK